jgi:hypothetical protein
MARGRIIAGSGVALEHVRADVISIRTPLPLAGAESNGAGRSRPEPADVPPGDGRRYALPLALATGERRQVAPDPRSE